MRYAEAGGLRASRMAVPLASTTQQVAIRRAARSAISWLTPRSSGHTPGLQLGNWDQKKGEGRLMGCPMGEVKVQEWN